MGRRHAVASLFAAFVFTADAVMHQKGSGGHDIALKRRSEHARQRHRNLDDPPKIEVKKPKSWGDVEVDFSTLENGVEVLVVRYCFVEGKSEFGGVHHNKGGQI